MDGAPDAASTPSQSPGPETPLREPEAEALRARILVAVASCCAERGYAATTSDQIARRAGVSRAQFGVLFRDKEDAYLAMCNMLLGELLTAATSAYSPDKPLVQWVREAAGAILELLAARPTLAKIAFLDCRTATGRALQLYQSGVRVLVSLLDQVRNDSLQEVPIPSRAARGAIGGAEALLRHEIAAGRAEQLPMIHPQIVYSCLVPLLGQEEALRQAEIADRELAGT
ncbi:MAG TPA: TetR/AcrR family transcriptional regulator [Solirubrobacterales bacterium]